MNNKNRTKVITGVSTRLSYFHGWEPVSINGGAEKYSVSVLKRALQSLAVKNQIRLLSSYHFEMVM